MKVTPRSMQRPESRKLLMACLLGLFTAYSAVSMAQTAKPEAIPVNPERNAYFGDLHLHTALSADASLIGASLLPEDSYRFAMGETVTYMGLPMKRIAPLDFLAVTDHAEYLGVIPEVRDPKGPWAGTATQKQWLSTDQKVIGQTYGQFMMSLRKNSPIPDLNRPEALKSGWAMLQEAAAKYNKPGKFTTFVAYEWTSQPVGDQGAAQNLHRCVIFKGAKVPDMPFSSFDSEDPEALWTYLETARKTGDDVIAVPHNANLSNGLMFDTKTMSGKPLTKEYAERRMNNEPLTEIAQGKGQSETNPSLSPNDEFANFEVLTDLLNSGVAGKIDGSYVRQAYGVGQELQEKIGANPFKYGLEGGTDYHSGLSTTEENNYRGSHDNQDNYAKDYKKLLASKGSIGGESIVKIEAGALTGVWAESNTRDAIFDALKRKESFGTSGVRLKVRFFAGWNYKKDMIKQADWIKEAYKEGVPMGGDMPAGAGKPKFLVQAVKDPNSGNLDRVQIVKVSTKNGKSTENVYDVVWSGNRKLDDKGKLPAVGNTVDLKTAKYTNTIGSAELTGYWEDKDFDPDAYVTYYARVLEIPTPRWSTIIAVKYGVPLSDQVAPTIQERAWTSPVWYTPTTKVASK